MPNQPKSDLPKLTGRDYLVGGLIIIGVPAAWFLLIAFLSGSAGIGGAISIVVVISFIVYLLLKRSRRKDS